MSHDVARDEQKPVILTPLRASTRAGLRLQHIMFAVGVSAFLMWLWQVATVWLFVLVFFLIVVAAVSAAVFFVRRNLSQQETLLWALAISAEKSLPLAPAALAFSDQFGNTFRWRIQLLAGLLNQGASLTEALDQVPNVFRREAQVLIWTGAATGTLPRALREAADLRDSRRASWGWLAGRFAYLVFLLLMIQMSLLFLIGMVAPRYTMIMTDFCLVLPPATSYAIALGQWLFNDYVVLTVAAIALEVLLVLVLPLSFFNVFQWNIPALDSLFRRRHANLVLRALALAVGGNRPISEGLGSLAATYPSGWVRQRLKKVETAVRGGHDWVNALATAGLLRRVDAAVLASAGRVGNLDWALRETAASGERRIGYWLQFWLQFLFPAVLLGLGAMIFLISLAYFTPLLTLIEALAG